MILRAEPRVAASLGGTGWLFKCGNKWRGGVKSDTPNGRDEVCWSVQLMRRLLEVNGLGPAGSKRHWDTREDRC